MLGKVLRKLKSVLLVITKTGIFSIILWIFTIPFSTQVKGAEYLVNDLNFDFFSQEHGLSNNQIHCILQDRKGWMWFGTSQGVCRFDGYKFTVFKNDPDDPFSLKGNLVRTIFEDRSGTIWVGTENGGLNKFNREKENFRQLFSNGEQAILKDATVTAVFEDKTGNLWIGTRNRLYKMKGENSLLEIKPAGYTTFEQYFRVIFGDKSGRIWLGTNNGLFVFTPSSNVLQKINLKQANSANQEIWSIYADDDGMLWIGTYASGVICLDTRTLAINPISLDPGNDRSFTVRAIAKDIHGKYWIGTRGGLYIYEKTKGVTAFYHHDEREPQSLVNNSIQCIFHDKKGDVWVGTRNGINFLIEERQHIRSYKSMPGDNRFLNSGEIYAFWMDPDQNLWIGTENGGINILNRKTGRFRYLLPQKGNPNSLSVNCIKALESDGKGNLWIGTFLGGIDVLDISTQQFKHFKHYPGIPASLSDNRVWALLCDNKNNMWVGTGSGLDRFDPQTGKFLHFPHITMGQQVNWLAQDSSGTIWIGADDLILYEPDSEKVIRIPEETRYMLQDSQNRFWLATLNNGIALFSKERGIIKYYNEKSGLANNQALAILEDNEGFLWISTTNGLSKFNAQSERFHNYYTKNGFLNNQFTYGASYKTNNGELIFGGISGFNIFSSLGIKSADYFPPIVFTDLKVLNKSIKIGNSKNDILTRSISETEEIVLKYNQNSVTIDFASFDFANSPEIQYSYFLENFDNGWNEPSVIRSATYTNLDPGEYKFRVKTLSVDHKESREGPVLKIVVRPPYWKTWWFRSLLVAVMLVFAFGIYLFLINKEKLKNELVLERLNAKKLHEFDMMKLRFYTNVSHEIRTPLTLILGPLEKIKNNMLPPKQLKEHVDIMYRNASQLLQLINQLLDFRKSETGNLKLNLACGDLVSFLENVTGSFNKLAEDKEIELRFTPYKKEIVTWFDAEKVGKIMNNLLSNAFKFTDKGGKITVNLTLINAPDENTNNDAGKKMIEISVKDTGIGIEASNLQKIFTRFFQVNDGANQTGTGIGLALTQELVKLHHGEIQVQSKPGQGSKFTVILPFEAYAAQAKVAASFGETDVASVEINLNEEDEADVTPTSQKVMLLIDDNADVRYFIKSHFEQIYKILEAKNGMEGWNIAVKNIPDIIISDVMMPDMDGFEFCRKVKKDMRTSHIPIILLTALGSRDHEIEGLSRGADDYITKPFDVVVLQTKVENILSMRQALRLKYTGELLLQPSNVVLSSPDERFLQKAIEVIEHHIADPELDIERFASEIGVSRMQLYRKFDALTGMTAKEFVRSIRLKRATQLLLQKKLNISEIAYAVGFRDLSHFRKCFRQEFGMNASAWADKHSS